MTRGVVGGLRPHLLFVVAFTVGLALRIGAVVAYPQPFLINDSRGYVDAAHTLVPQVGRQSGVALFMRLVPDWQRLTTVTAVQHLLGLALAVFMYAVLRRRTVPGWAATLATLPVLLDPFELNLEHYILTDFLFSFLLSVALLLLIWWQRIPAWTAAVAGALLGMSLVVRGAADLVVVLVAVVLLIGQTRWQPALALLAAAVVPVAGYMAWYHHSYGRYSTGRFPHHILYGRVMTAVDCSTLDLPADEQPLCVKAPPGRGVTWYTWNSHSGLNKLYAAAGARVETGKTPTVTLVSDFNRRAIRQQPVQYATAVMSDVAKGFAPLRTVGWPHRGADPWLFSTQMKRPELVTELTGDRTPRLHPRPARLMTVDNALYFPGPVYAIGLLLALLALFYPRGHRRLERAAIALLALPVLLLLLSTAAVAGFSWRYQLPQLSLIPPAAALAATAVVRRRPEADEPTATTDSAA